MKGIVIARLEILFTEVTREPMRFKPTDKLGEKTGLDAARLRGLLPLLNGTTLWSGRRFGFDDMLGAGKKLHRDDVGTRNSVGSLADRILHLSKDGVGKMSLYRAKMRERTRLALRYNVAKIAGPQLPDGSMISFQEKVATYIAEERLSKLAFELTHDLYKYLFGAVERDMLEDTLEEAHEWLQAIATEI